MRVLLVEPGPDFSVADVCNGWERGLREIGCEVVRLNYGARLDFYGQVALHRDGEWRAAFDTNGAVQMASKGIEAAAYECWPDIVLIVSCFFVPRFTLDLLRSRGHKVVVHHTESPYEDDGQLQRAPHVDLNLLNDPTNLERFAELAPSVYMPHAYDPAIHRPRPAHPDLASDFCFVGTGFPSRIDFLEAVDWDGIDVALAGMWKRLSTGSPLRKFLAHDIDDCCNNADAARLYASTKASVNLYRTEAERPELEHGWALGPREVELAACGTFFLRQSRGEGDEVLGMLPTFDGPGDFGERLRWWLAHDDKRQEAAHAARRAIADRTFAANAAQLLRLLAG